MDSQKFDSVVKSLASPTSRRRVLKGVGAISAGGLLTALGRQTTEAAPCRPNQTKCAGGCFPRGWVCDKDGGKPEGTNRGQVDRN
jgi:hypothetical protein